MFSAAFPRSPHRFDGGSLVPWERTGRLYVPGMVLHGCARACFNCLILGLVVAIDKCFLGSLNSSIGAECSAFVIIPAIYSVGSLFDPPAPTPSSCGYIVPYYYSLGIGFE